jgi:hypothetical protein
MSGLPESGHGWAIYEYTTTQHPEREHRRKGHTHFNSTSTPSAPMSAVRVRVSVLCQQAPRSPIF